MRAQRAFLSFVAMGTIITKMATPQQKEFCVLKFESCKSCNVRFVGSLIVIPPMLTTSVDGITTGCLCKGKSVRVSEDNVQRVRDAFVRSPKKSVRKASRELAIPVMTVWKVLKKRLHMRPYHLQLLQALKPTDYAVHSNYAHEMLHQENDDFLLVMPSTDVVSIGGITIKLPTKCTNILYLFVIDQNSQRPVSHKCEKSRKSVKVVNGIKGAARNCISRYLAEDSIICVCNATYCDSIEPVLEADIQDGSYVQYESTQAGKRMYFKKGKFLKKIEPNTFIKKIYSYWTTTSFTVDHHVRYQEFVGFGGGLTDSFGGLIMNLSEPMRKQLLRQYFGNEGLNYSLIRMPMGNTDFSTHKYTYDDNDTGYSLSKFGLCEEDYKIKIPLLKHLEKISSQPIKIIATPWNVPNRMKETREPLGWLKSYRLKDDYYLNEPYNSLVGLPPDSNLGWTIAEQGKFIGQNLGPLLNATGYGNVKIFALDEDWIFNKISTRLLMAQARKYISGIALHGYFQGITHPGVTTDLHNCFQDFSNPLYGLEDGQTWKNMLSVSLIYDFIISSSMNNWLSGWMDWNMALSEAGGPSFVITRTDAPIIINHTNEEFYKQPMWYAIAHFANFIPTGSIRVDLKEWRAFGILSTAFITPEKRVVVVMMNRRDSPWEIVINVGNDEQIQVTLASRSVNTFIYQAPKYKNMDFEDYESEKININPTSKISSSCKKSQCCKGEWPCVSKSAEVFGFGGALTDTVGMLLSQLKEETQDQLLRQYFSDEGLNYTFLRIPIAASDFSTHWYTYDDFGEGHSLSNFSLCEEDFKYKIPYIRKMENISSTRLKIIAVPWIAPRRMLEPRYFEFYTMTMRLKDEYYPTYAEYIMKFLNSYKKEGISIWGLTPQNEPKNGLYGGLYPVNLGWTPWEQGEWIRNNLGPMLHCNGFDDIKIIIYDGQRDIITLWTSIVSHHFISKPVRIGRWENLELYINSIADIMNNWGSGWLDWNLVLDETGGPSFMKNWLDSPIIINVTADEFYKQPTWYGIAHYSHFVPPGSRRIDLKEWFANGITGSAFVTPEDRIVIVLLNRRDSTYEAIINVGKEEQIKIIMTPRSLHTIIYKNML
ncbi:hypothetical protein C0J52_05333 [Blattella germanica]|nr:hypothetical protein C0J52_05333 [Blattella germanica]